MRRSDLYLLGAVWGLLNAVLRGPDAVLRFFFRRTIHRAVARAIRRAGM